MVFFRVSVLHRFYCICTIFHCAHNLGKPHLYTIKARAFSSNFGEKMINLTSNLGEINDIEHNKDSKIYPQDQVILDCIMSSIPLSTNLKYHLIWVIVSHN